MPSDIQPSTTVYLAAFAALLGALSMGFCLGYSSPALNLMGSDNCTDNDCGDNTETSTILDNTSDETRESQSSLIGSMLNIGALLGGILGEPCNKLLGRRMALVAYGLPFMLGWVLIAVAKNVTVVVVGRVVTGICCGLVSQTAPTYVVEISPPSIRGMLGTCFQVMVTIGILFAPIFATFMSWQMLAIACSISAILMSVLMYFMPETPQCLLSRGQGPEAEAALKKLRTSPINEEFASMSQLKTESNNQESVYSMQNLTSRVFLLPLALATGLMFFQQFSGINGILFYQTKIFEKAAPNFKAIWATISVCTAQVIATIVGSLLVDRLGRRVLLIASGIGHTVSLLVFGYYQYEISRDKAFADSNAWIALISLIFFVLSFSIGFGPIPWMMIPEISSNKVRSLVASLSTAFNWFCAFVVTRTIESVKTAIGEPSTYWIFALICAMSCVFVYSVLPETKGRSEESIQEEILGPHRPIQQHPEPGSNQPKSSIKEVA